MANGKKKKVPSLAEYEKAIGEVMQTRLDAGHIPTRPFMEGFDDPSESVGGRVSSNVCTTETCDVVNQAMEKIGMDTRLDFTSNKELLEATRRGETPFEIVSDISAGHRKGDIMLFGTEKEGALNIPGGTHSSLAMEKYTDKWTEQTAYPYYTAAGGGKAVAKHHAVDPESEDAERMYLRMKLPEDVREIAPLKRRPLQTNPQRPRPLARF